MSYKNYNTRLLVLVLMILLTTISTVCAEPLANPTPRISSTTVFWNQIAGAEKYNIHLADGTYITTVNGLQFNALDFFDLDRGGSLVVELIVVSVAGSDWTNWGQSDIVSINYAASCLGCVNNSPPSEPSSSTHFSGNFRIESYINECFSASVQVSGSGGPTCTAHCANGGIALGGSCELKAKPGNRPDTVYFGSSSRILESQLQCILPAQPVSLLALQSTATVKCLVQE